MFNKLSQLLGKLDTAFIYDCCKKFTHIIQYWQDSDSFAVNCTIILHQENNMEDVPAHIYDVGVARYAICISEEEELAENLERYSKLKAFL